MSTDLSRPPSWAVLAVRLVGLAVSAAGLIWLVLGQNPVGLPIVLAGASLILVRLNE